MLPDVFFVFAYLKTDDSAPLLPRQRRRGRRKLDTRWHTQLLLFCYLVKYVIRRARLQQLSRANVNVSHRARLQHYMVVKYGSHRARLQRCAGVFGNLKVLFAVHVHPCNEIGGM